MEVPQRRGIGVSVCGKFYSRYHYDQSLGAMTQKKLHRASVNTEKLHLLMHFINSRFLFVQNKGFFN